MQNWIEDSNSASSLKSRPYLRKVQATSAKAGAKAQRMIRMKRVRRMQRGVKGAKASVKGEKD